MSKTAEERIQELEEKLERCGESVDELTFHCSTLHNFLIQQFGEKFKTFVFQTSNNSGNGITGEGEGEEDGLGVAEWGEGEEAYGEGDGTGGEEGDYDDGDEGENQGEYQIHEEDPADLLKVEVEDSQDDDDEDEGQGQGSWQSPVAGSRVGNGVQSRVPSLQMNGKGVAAFASSQPGPSTSTRPPILQRRPPVGSSSGVRPGVIGAQVRPGMYIGHQMPGSTRQAASSAASRTPVIGGNRGNEVLLSNDDEDFKAGKYSKFYRKVNEDLIQCKMCHKILKRKGKFIQHLRTHTGEKPFKCPACPAAFSRKDNMNVHVAKHHPPGSSKGRVGVTTKPVYGHQCGLCAKVFANESIYHSHMKLVHGVEQEDQHDQDLDQMEEYGEGYEGYEEDGGGDGSYDEEMIYAHPVMDDDGRAGY